MQRALVKLVYPLGLGGYDQRPLPQRVLRGHAGGAGAGVTKRGLMQPGANMKPRAELHQSAPIAIVFVQYRTPRQSCRSHPALRGHAG